MPDGNNNAIVVRDLEKSFKLPHEQHSGLKQVLLNVFSVNKKRGYETQHVLKGLSFEVKKGDFFGIVGRNGSGKSTLLKLLAGIYTPDKGSVAINGSLTPFIELGVGFNPDLTGRENIFLNGALLGFSRQEMELMYDDIVSFAELKQFMDQKLKNYSSGMQVRLAFSIAIKAESDILILDEVLAVGDEAFQRKCEEYFNSLKQKKKTVILVTHDMNSVRKYCNRAVMIQDGELVVDGTPEDIANAYSLENIRSAHGDSDDDEYEYKGVENLKIELLSTERVDERGEIKFALEYDTVENINTVVAFSITDIDRNIWLQNDNSWNNVVKGKGHHKVIYTCNLPSMINNCSVKIQASVWDEKGEIQAYLSDRDSPRIMIRRNDINNRHNEGVATGLLYMHGNWEVIE